MSLENAIADLAEKVGRQNELLEQLLSEQGSAPAASDDAGSEEKPKRTRRNSKKDDDAGAETKGADNKQDSAADDDNKRAEVIAAVGNWVKEVEKTDPEFEARRAAAVSAFQKLNGAKGDTVKDLLMSIDVDQFERVTKWLDKKKTTDNGHGVGRLTPEPQAETPEGDDDI